MLKLSIQILQNIDFYYCNLSVYVAGVFGSFPKTIVKRKLLVKAFAIAI